MDSCPACRTPVPAGSAFCPACGKAIEAVTYEAVGTGSASPAPVPFPAADFTPGFLLAGRYRIVALLGRGGMGEVYRADDLKLGQPVALKFLPRTLERNPARLDRFLAEIRTARDVSHPNVCRVYDVGELDGRHFLSMEYIDGEDLASLLRRIGRLPQDKALDIARQLCAGLAAAHDKGVLHRDLKPANVMLDGRGKVRLTDFGLAEIAGSGTGDFAGTPAYMAPEQFTGRPASVQSDVYALGLVLYEVFTGRQVFSADTVAELRRLHEESRPASLTSAVHDIDPLVERVILRCLEKDPRNRPVSAIAVSAALPGGDPLAAALAAGETPSPAMVAAAGEEGGMRPAVAAAWLAAVVAGLVAVTALTARAWPMAVMPLPYSPEVLASKADEMLGRLGVATARTDSAIDLEWEPGYAAYVQAHRTPASERRHQIETGHAVVTLWRRTSPAFLIPSADVSITGGTGSVSLTDPPATTPGMTSVTVDSRGRLLRFEAIPAQIEPATTETPAPIDWPKVLAETGIDAATLAPTQPRWLPSTYADVRAAWTGRYADLPDLPVRIEAAAYRGKPVYLCVVRPWTPPDRPEPAPKPPARMVQQLLGLAINLLLLVGSALIAWRNIGLGRGDRRGAVRVGIGAGVLYVASVFFHLAHVQSDKEVVLLVSLVGAGLFVSAWTTLLYLGLEPYVRRFWPHTLISWNRLLIGRVRDPLLARDVLIGAAAGVGLTLFRLAYAFAVRAPGVAAPTLMPPLTPLLGTRFVIDSLCALLFSAGLEALIVFFLLFLFRLLLRRDWLAVVAFVGLMSLLDGLRLSGTGDVLLNAILVTAETLVLVRLGLVAIAATVMYSRVLVGFPFSMDLSSWQSAPTMLVVPFLVVVAAAAFKITLAGKPLLGATVEK